LRPEAGARRRRHGDDEPRPVADLRSGRARRRSSACTFSAGRCACPTISLNCPRALPRTVLEQSNSGPGTGERLHCQ
jgi:hypothetical protein